MQAFNWESERQKDTDTDAQMDRGLRLQETEIQIYRELTERRRQIYTPRKEQRYTERQIQIFN